MTSSGTNTQTLTVFICVHLLFSDTKLRGSGACLLFAWQVHHGRSLAKCIHIETSTLQHQALSLSLTLDAINSMQRSPSRRPRTQYSPFPGPSGDVLSIMFREAREPAGHRREEALAAGGTLTHGVNDAPTTSPFGRQYEYPTSAKTQ